MPHIRLFTSYIHIYLPPIPRVFLLFSLLLSLQIVHMLELTFLIVSTILCLVCLLSVIICLCPRTYKIFFPSLFCRS
ncbi:hypothetical protein BDP27DRAFT_1318632 [Rhodocollybia butyracea]|uniref:Uncharacterized protein n=1 Tax=Rhodocollybia butyracea TaxID=206335 RepID=A0A9P5PW87_9AGAR|nr:hypothetical protein BDP27DRAFT_1318632 [Rhodocollybia butyracea]